MWQLVGSKCILFLLLFFTFLVLYPDISLKVKFRWAERRWFSVAETNKLACINGCNNVLTSTRLSFITFRNIDSSR